MHPDRKVGFAMGILLVGVIAALFFRNEPMILDELPSVTRERELNQQLRERDVAIYLEDDGDSGASESSISDSDQPTLKDLLGDMHDRQPSIAVPIGVGAVTTDTNDIAAAKHDEPLKYAPPVVPDDDPESRQAFAEDNSQTEPVEMFDLEDVTSEPTEPEIEYDEYTVQYGDTLSGIAERFLGSQRRYQELYEANKDRMSGPDRLQVGKAIRIPRTIR